MVGRGHYGEQSYEIILYLDWCFRELISFNDLFNFSSGSFCLTERNHMCSFSRGPYWEHSSGIFFGVLRG